VKDTLKYFKSNPLLIVCYLVAAFSIGFLINPEAYSTIASSAQDGTISGSFFAWLKFFILFNPDNALTIVTGIAAYLLLISDLALIHSLVDKHVRFGTKSLRSIGIGYNINIVNGLIFSIFAMIVQFVVAAINAAIMKTCELIPVAYSYALGVAICFALIIFILFVAGLFLLWLPCVEVTGFKKFDALSYAYALARPRAWKIFASLALPAIVTIAICTTVGLLCIKLVTYLVIPVVLGIFFVYVAVLSYMIYAEAEGISREDLKKY
jgi:hypothetical protein